MASQSQPDIILYDLKCTKGVCFSPVVWRIRLLLNYKGISYETVFLDFQEIEPTLRSLGVELGAASKYTVPTIRHVASNTVIMDSNAIAQFIESTYPVPALPMASELGTKIAAEARANIGKLQQVVILPREIKILSPEAQVFFRRTREEQLGHPLEDLYAKEGEAWLAINQAMAPVDELIMTNRADGPFILGAKPSYTDFFLAGSLRSTKVIDEAVFVKLVKYAGFEQVYTACLPFMSKET